MPPLNKRNRIAGKRSRWAPFLLPDERTNVSRETRALVRAPPALSCGSSAAECSRGSSSGETSAGAGCSGGHAANEISEQMFHVKHPDPLALHSGGGAGGGSEVTRVGAAAGGGCSVLVPAAARGASCAGAAGGALEVRSAGRVLHRCRRRCRASLRRCPRQDGARSGRFLFRSQCDIIFVSAVVERKGTSCPSRRPSMRGAAGLCWRSCSSSPPCASR